MAKAHKANSLAMGLAQASIANSLLLPFVAALQWNAFLVIVATNFALMHAVWLVQLAHSRQLSGIDFGLVKQPLIAFTLLG